MDIEDMGMRLALAYDKIRAVNTELKSEAYGLKGEIESQLADMDRELTAEKDTMKASVEAELAGFRKVIKEQTEELRKEFRRDLSVVGGARKTGADDPQEEDESHRLAKELESELAEMKEQMHANIKNLEEQAQTQMTSLIERSDDELDAELGEIIARAKNAPSDEEHEE